MSRFLGVDLGTSFLKTAVLDLEDMGVSQVSRIGFPEPLPDLPPLHREYDALEIADLTRRLIARAPRVEGIVFCGQMHGLVLTGKRGEARSHYISWADQRAAGCFDQIASQVSEDERRELGHEFRPSLALCFLYWMMRNGGLPPDAIPCSLADFVVANLCRTAPVLEPTQAAAMGAYNLARGEWHRGVLDRLGLGALAWPAVRPGVDLVGSYEGIPCYTTVGDHQCSLAGVSLEEGELSLNVATGSQVGAIAPRFAPAAHQTRPYFDGWFRKTVTHIPAGRALNSLIALLTEVGGTGPDPWAYLEQAAAKVERTDLRAHLAFYPGACGDHGWIENLHEGNITAGHLFRAALESMAANYAGCAARIAGAEPWRRIVLSGGLALRSGLLRRLILDRFGLPHRLAPEGEDALRGLLLLALVVSGRCRDLREAGRRLA